VFVTQYRRGVFTTEMLGRCEHAMAQVCTDFDATLAEFNGEEDHVHLLGQYPPKVALSHLANSLRGVSSPRLRQDFVGRINRAGTRGRFSSPSYFAGSCGSAPLRIVKDHIADQKQPDQAKLPPCPEGQGFRPRSPMSTEANTSSAIVGPAADAAADHGSTEAEGGLRRGLSNRHIQMIALGGAIGTGLFYGSAESIGMAGPSIVLAYLLGGAVIFLIMRALGEMSVHTPVAGAFSYYASQNWGPFAGFFSGWNYWFNYIAVSMAELAVVGFYVNYWLPGVPMWVSAAIFIVLVTAVNLIDVKAFGEFEFWFAIIKVVAILAMIGLGTWIVLFGVGHSTPATGISNLWAHGGYFPHGLWGMLTALVVVMFSFGGVELVGITAGEVDNPRRTIPKAINQVVYRILIFYIGAIFVMLCIFPWDKIGTAGSPFVTIFGRLGVAGAATLLNVVVLTAAVSAYNSGLYSNGRMLYSLSQEASAPRYLSRLNKAGSPYAGILTSSAVTALAVLLNFLFPGNVFLYVMSVALIAAIFNWAMVVITQLKFRKRIGPAEVAKLEFKMPFYPFANYAVLAFLAGVIVLMGFLPDFRYALYVGPLWVAILYAAYRIKTSATCRSHRDL
jgi:AAT family amino acid transporter